MTGQVFVGGQALTPKDCAAPERSQEYIDVLGSSLAVYYKMQRLAEDLEWEIECVKRGVLSSMRRKMRGPKGFAIDVHLLEVHDAIINLKAEIIGHRMELARLRSLNPMEVWQTVNKIGMDFFDDQGNVRIDT
jgi:hypothetical protein